MTSSRLAGRLLGSVYSCGAEPFKAPDDGGAKGAIPTSLRFAALEQRMLFDAAGAASFADAEHVATQSLEYDQYADAQHDALLAALDAPVAEVAVAETPAATIVFIDSSVEDIDALLAGIDPGSEVYILDSNRGGVDQIADVLQDRSNVGALHIISHGRSGDLQIGTSHLTAQSLAGQYADEMVIIAGSLTERADILIYGCEFGAGQNGLAAMSALAMATGADVAASDDLTGAANLGGDWDLERSTGAIETRLVSGMAWNHVLTLGNTGTWTTSGLSSTNTTQGITATIAFSSISPQSSVVIAGNETFAVGTFFANGADADPSLRFTFNWDTTPEAAPVSPPPAAPTLPAAATDGGTATLTITFSQAVTNPIINLDRLGGNSGFDPDALIANNELSQSNSALFTLTTPGATLTDLTVPTDVPHFQVSSTTIQRTPFVNQSYSPAPSAEAATGINSTAAGSVRVNGTFTSITFVLSGVGPEGAGGDGIEIGLAVDAPPVARNDSFTLNEDATLTGNLFANNGAGVDSDPTGDTITVTKINNASFTVGTAISLPNGTLTITNATTGAFTFVPNSNFAGGQAFNYTISDANGGVSTASVSMAINGVNDAPAGTDATLVTAEDTPYTFASSNFGFTDTLDAPANAFQSVKITTLPAAGTLLLSGVVVSTGQVIPVGSIGSLTWAPPANGNGVGLSSFTFQVIDNGGVANGGVNTDQSPNKITFDVTPVNDGPTIDLDAPPELSPGSGYANTFTEGQPAVSIADSDMKITDDGSITKAVITLTNPQTLDKLNAPGALPPGISIDPSSTSTSIVLVGTATSAAYETAIKAITFENTSTTPNTSVIRAVNVTVTDDGNLTSNLAVTSINVIDVPNIVPTLDADANNSSGQSGANFETTYVENSAAVSIVDADASISDGDNLNMVSGVVKLINKQAGDVMTILGVAVANGATGIVSGISYTVTETAGTLSIALSGTATQASYIAALQAIKFQNISESPVTVDRIVQATVNDGSSDSNIATLVIHVVPVDDAPIVDLNSGAVAGNDYLNTYIENGPAAALADIANSIADVDDANMESATILLTNGKVGDVLTVGALPAGITVVGAVPGHLLADGTITLQLTGSASLADYQAALRAIAFLSNNENMDTTTRDVTVVVNDGDLDSSVVHVRIAVTSINDSPVVLVTPGGAGTVAANDGSPRPIIVVPPLFASVDDLPVFSVGQLLGQLSVTDVEQTAFGIAVVSADESHGRWQYHRTDIAGHSWTDFDPSDPSNIDVEPTPSGSVILFGPNTEFRFIPDADFNASARFEFRVWDMSLGTPSNPVSTTPDNSGGVAPLASSPFSGGIFVASVGADSDGDGVPNSQDIDDDNDGLLDVTEMDPGPSGNISWTHNDNNGAFMGANVDGSVSGLVTSTSNVSFGSGFTPPNSLYEHVLLSADANTFAEAVANDEYVEVKFTLSQAALLNTIQQGLVPTAWGGSAAGGYKIAAAISTDGFATANLLYDGVMLPIPSSGYASTYTPVGTLLDAGSYTVRLYLYDEQNTASLANGTPLPDNTLTFDDLFLNFTTYTPRDSDGDGVQDQLDVDSDNDGIADNVEAQTTGGYIKPTGTGAAMADADSDGLDDAYDSTPNGGILYSNGLTPVNTDGTDKVDYLDTDADNDGMADVAERDDGQPTSIASTTDTDGDGLLDIFEGGTVSDGFDVNDSNLDSASTNFLLGDADNDTAANGAGATPLINDLDYRDNNEPPVANDDALTTNEDAPLTTNIITANGIDIDPDGDPLLVQSATVDTDGDGLADPLILGTATQILGAGSVPIGILTLAADGTLTFVPAPNYNGTVPPLNYVLTDGKNQTDAATVTITITPVNDAPVDDNETATTAEDTALLVPAATGLLAGATDPDGDSLAITEFTVPGLVGPQAVGIPVTIPGVGDITINGDGSYTFAPAPDYNGPVPPITYTVSDGNGGEDTSVLQLTITPVNDAPVDADEANTVTEDTSLSVPAATGLLASATDSDGDTLTIAEFTVPGLVGPQTVGTPVAIPGVGTITINVDGSYDFTPEADYAGPVPPITYTVSDGNGGTDTSVLQLTITPVNDLPVDADEANTATEDAPLVVLAATGLLTGATDADGEPLTITGFTVPGLVGSLPVGTPVAIPGVGTVTINADGSYSFMPEANYNGPVPPITYTVSDGQGGEDTSVLQLTITPVNDAPVATDDGPTAVTEDTSVTGDVLGNDTDVDGDPLSVTEFTVAGVAGTFPAGSTATIPGVGTLVINADGSYTFTPEPNYAGPVPMATYTITDGAATDTAGLSFADITPVNDPPVDPDEANTVTEDVPLVVPAATGLLAGATDVEGDALTITSFTIPSLVGPQAVGTPVTIPGVGDITINADGSYTFAPAPNYTGPVPPITYTVSDGQGGEDTSVLQLTITPVNDAPVVVDPANPGDPLNPTPAADPNNIIPDISTTDGATPTNPNVAQYFVDPEGDTLTFTATGLPTGLTMNPDGTITGMIDPNASQQGPNSDGVYQVVVTADDGNGGITTTTITYTVTNPPPVAVDDTKTVTEDTPATGNVLTDGTPDSDTAPDNDPLTVTQFVISGTTYPAGTTANLPGVGTLVINANGSYTFTPAPNYVGPVPAVTYTISDGNGGSDTADLTLTITPVNDAPVVVDPANPGDPLNPTPAADPNNIIPDISTTDGASSTDPNVAQYFVDPEGDPLTFTATGLPPGLTMNPDGTITGVIDPSASLGGPNSDGVYQVVVTADDSNGGITTTTITYTVTNPPPGAVDDLKTVTEDTPVTGNVLTDGTPDSDTAPDSDPLMVTQFAVNGTTYPAGTTANLPGVGTLVINADGSYTFTPVPNYDSPVPVVTYTVSDGQGGTDTADLTLIITPVNDAPVVVDPANPGDPLNPTPAPDPNNIVPDISTTDGASPTDPNVAQYFVDPDGDPLTFTSTGLPPGLTMNPDGTITGAVDPDASQGGPNSDGVYEVVVTADDGNGGITTTTITYTVTNPPPVATDDSKTVTEDTPATGNVLNDGPADSDTAPDGDPLTVTQFVINSTTYPAGTTANLSGVGDLVINADGSYSFTPAPNYDGPVPVATYTISDGQGGTDTGTLTLTITPVNDAPVVVDPANPGDPLNPTPAADPNNIIPDVATTDGSTPASINAADYFVDPEGDLLTFSATDLPPGLSMAPDGTITGVIDPSASQGSSPGQPAGTYLVTITADDSNGNLVTTTVTYTITNPPPMAVDDVATVTEDTPATGNVLTDGTSDVDTAPDADPLTVVSFDIPGVGTTPAGSTAAIPGVGTLLVNADGSYTFTPAPNYDGPVPVATYTISDGQGGTDTGTLTLTITPVNDAPVVVDPANPGDPVNPTPAADPQNIIPDVTTTDGSTPAPVTAADYFVDPEGDALTFTATDLPPGLTMAPDGTISGTVDPSASQSSSPGQPVGTYLVVITADDGNGHPVTTTVTYTISNPPPVAVDDVATVTEDVPATGNVLTDGTADADGAPDTDPLTVTSFEIGGTTYPAGTTASLPGVGDLVINADGSYTFTPAPNYDGPVPVATYTISDGQGGTDTGTLTLTITPVNDAPVVVDPANPGDPLNPTPAADPNNIIPDVTTTDGSTPAPINAADYFVDPEGDTLTFTATDLPPGLTMAPDGTISGVIDPSASQGSSPGQPAGTYLVTITADDGNGNLVSTTVTYTVSNPPPAAVDDVKAVTEDTPVSGNVLLNDADTGPDSDPLTVVSFNIPGVGTTPAGLTATIPGVGDLVINADGSYTFTPAPNYNGPVPVATYTVSDGNGGIDTGDLVLGPVAAVNDAPVVIDPANPGTPLNPIPAADPQNIIPDVSTTDGAPAAPINAALYFADPEGDPLTFTATGLPPGLTIAPNGTISGTVDPSASQGSSPGQPAGTYLVTITADDGNGNLVTTTVTYTITNPPPVAVDDHATGGTEDAPQSGNVLTNPLTGDADTGPDSDPLTVIAVSGGTVGAPVALAYGTLTLKADGSWTFTPNALANTLPAGALVQQTVTYTISDGNGGTDTATLTIDVNGVNDAPVLLSQTPEQSGLEGHPVMLNVGSAFADFDSGDVLTFSASGLPPGLSIDPATGLISGTFAPNSSAGGPYTVTVQVSDGKGGQATMTFVWEVKAESFPDAPKPAAPLALPLLSVASVLSSRHPISDTIDGLRSLNGTPEFEDLFITRTVEQLGSLNSATDIEPGDGVVQRLVEWAGQQGRKASWMHDLLEALDHEPYLGDSLNLSLTLDDTDLFNIRTVLHNGALYIGVDHLTDAGDVIDISLIKGSAAVAKIGSQDVIINVQPGRDWYDFTITGKTADGRKATWAISVNTTSGEVFGVKTKAVLPKLADTLRAANTQFAQSQHTHEIRG